MQEITGDIWDYLGRGAVLVITTNGSLTRDGRAVLGRGVARQAALRFPGLVLCLGNRLATDGNHVHDLGAGLVSFPVEESAWSLPDPRLIARSAAELRLLTDQRRWPQVVLPRPGCGGGLAWETVRPLLMAELDERFLVVTPVEPDCSH